VKAKIEELDFEGSIYDRTFLPDELIESGLLNFARAILSRVNTGVFPGSGAIQPHEKPHGLAVLRRSQHQVQVAAVNRNTILPGTACSTALSTLTFHDPLNPQLFKESFPGALKI
jgi:hypothetical protein